MTKWSRYYEMGQNYKVGYNIPSPLFSVHVYKVTLEKSKIHIKDNPEIYIAMSLDGYQVSFPTTFFSANDTTFVPDVFYCGFYENIITFYYHSILWAGESSKLAYYFNLSRSCLSLSYQNVLIYWFI